RSAPPAPRPATSRPAEPASPSPSGARDEAPAGASTHTVVPGDTLWDIAIRYGTTVSELLAANDTGPGAIIYPGEELRIPGSEPEPEPEPQPAAGKDIQRSATLDAAQ